MTANRKPRSAQIDRELRLWKVGWALGLTFTAAILTAGGIFYELVVLLDFRRSTPPPSLTPPRSSIW